MICKDPAFTYLTSFKYNVIAHPRAGIHPLLIVGGAPKYGLDIIGHLSKFIADAKLPIPQIDTHPASTITGKSTDKLELEFGVKLMNTFLTAMGMIGGKLELGEEKARTLEIVFENVWSDTIQPADLDIYLRSGKPVAESLLLDAIDKEGKAYIITEIIKSDSFSINVYNKLDEKIDMDITGIKEIIGVDSDVKITKDNESKVTYKGKDFLCFGFRAIEFWIDKENLPPTFHLKMRPKPIGSMKAVKIKDSQFQADTVEYKQEFSLFAPTELINFSDK